MTNNHKPGVLMVTGAYFPEVSGAGLQCRSLIGQLRHQVDFSVLTTTADRSLPADDVQDGVRVHRVFVNPNSWWSKGLGSVRFTRAFLREARRFSIVHFHGFSQKSILLMWLARLKKKRIAIKLTSVGHDDPESMRRRGGLAYRWYARADRFFAVNRRFEASYEAVGFPPERLRLIANGVDCAKFRPALPGERETLREELGLAPGARIVLFVGFFSHEKRPDLLFDAWANVAVSVAPDSVLIYVGATKSLYYEIDKGMSGRIRQLAHALGVEKRVRFVELTYEIERFHRAAEIFVLPSLREGMPNVLLEAMASGAPCIATRLEGVTDTLIEDERNGLLVPTNDRAALQAALKRCFENPQWAHGLGVEARRTAEERFSLEGAAEEYLAAYKELDGAGLRGPRD